APGPRLLEECRGLGGCRTGEAKITKGYNLKADYVIHTPGPVYSFHKHPEILLAGCYRNSLDLALQHDIHEISFPAISTGVYGYPKKEAAKIAAGTVREWLQAHPDYEILVRFVSFGTFDYDLYKKELQER
ncbi:MAG: macro domain-containing protein, partial [Stomatobaculum sp.]|nr:macro domain-containing protein [Stomatobaculum sp.]